MVLIDTSIWANHFRSTVDQLVELLEAKQVLMHPFVIGELSLGALHPRNETIASLRSLPLAVVATDDEVLEFIERHGLSGTGVGYVDAHLLAATALTPGARLWARDARMVALASRLGFAAGLIH